MSFPLLEELGIRPLSSDGLHPSARRAATPGGELASESVVVSVGRTSGTGHVGEGATHQHRNRLHTIDEDPRKHRQDVDDDDLFVVDWQHQYGFPTKRGTTPRGRRRTNLSEGNDGPSVFDAEQSFVSESKLLTGAEPWGPNGLLTELSVQRVPPQPKFLSRRRGDDGNIDGVPLAERSLASESLLLYAGSRTPNRSAPSSRQEVRERSPKVGVAVKYIFVIVRLLAGSHFVRRSSAL